MGLVKYFKKYKEYERRVLAKRIAKKKKIITYKNITKGKNIILKKIKSFRPKGKLSGNAYLKAIGNPYK